MGTVCLTGAEPFELLTQQSATASALGGNVAVTLPVFAAEFPHQTAEVLAILSIEHAEQLADQLPLAVAQARLARSR
jgi:hypothetical protein